MNCGKICCAFSDRLDRPAVAAALLPMREDVERLAHAFEV